MRNLLSAVLTLAAVLAGPAASAADAPAFIPGATIAGPDGRWDFASWDAEHHRVLVAHGNDVLVIDPASGSVKAIGEIAGAHAVLAVPGTDRILVSSGKDDSVRILDGITGAEVAHIAAAADPDAAILSADGRTAYVMGAKAGAVSVIDLVNGKEAARIALKPGLEVPVLAGNLLAVNNEDASEIELADLATGKAAGVIALPGCEGPTGMAYAPEAGLSLSTCANGKAALVNLRARKLVALLPIGQGPDTAIWDGLRHRFLVPCGKSGTLSIIGLASGKPRVEPAVMTEVSARTAALDPSTGKLYLPAGRFQVAESGMKPTLVSGSFHILTLEPAR
ncbi:DNA-binding beta-propeller fold protein YncE [Novosphingobium capsulatum]|uniref:DNA-binding beta-propeller fold protein YncE n=1 Tax=Novosphingobium capsulatum TaxID=13688 RepID=A0ABU1MNK3_9SPHN|nr:gluconolactonase [Novosphingobium capsulatum]MDR6511936.1 DNA-binding beta-propeller fold protein YncE [Novosphingobium capsulatum]